MLSPASSSPETLLRHNQPILHALRRRWLWIALGYAVATLAGFALLRMVWSEAYALRWLLLTSLFALRPLWLLWRHLDENHPKDSPCLLPGLGYANGITLMRGWCFAAVGGFFLSPWPFGWLGWLPAWLYITAIILDGIDGYVARMTNHTTKLGETLDITLDAWGLLAAVLVAVWYGQLPVWYLLLGVSRELFMAGQWWLERQGKSLHPLTPSMERRAIAGLQMGFIGLVLWPIFHAPTTTIAAVLFGAQLFLSFGRDWLVVSGLVNPASSGYQRGRSIGKQLAQEWLPVLLRLVSVALAAVIITRLVQQTTGVDAPVSETLTTSVALQLAQAARWLFVVLAIGALVMTALGVLPRFAAGVLLIVTLIDQQMIGFSWLPNGLLQGTTILLIQLGGGRWSLWRAEDRLWYKRAGERAGDSA